MKIIPESPALAPSGIAPAPVQPEAGSVNLPVAPAHNLGDFKWVPVLRKPRADGWTPQRQVDFIAALADTGCVEHAARAAGISANSCYRLRRSPGAEAFAAAWAAAIQQAAHRLVDIAFDRAINGSDEPVFDKEGRRVGRRMRQNDRLLMFLLRAFMPDRFRHAHESMRRPSEPPPAEPLPVAEALRTLEPAPPENPHLLMPPEELDVALQCAEILDGKLPQRHQGRGDDEAAPTLEMGANFEAALASAKREAAGLPPLSEDDEDEDDVLA